MGHFLGPLRIKPTGRHAPDTEHGPGNPIYELIEPLGYWTGGRTYTAPAGYQTDLASIPREYQERPPHESPAARPGVIHDYLYTSHEVPRSVADAIFREALAEEGVPLKQRLLMWLAVRLFGAAAYNARLGWHP